MVGSLSRGNSETRSVLAHVSELATCWSFAILNQLGRFKGVALPYHLYCRNISSSRGRIMVSGSSTANYRILLEMVARAVRVRQFKLLARRLMFRIQWMLRCLWQYVLQLRTSLLCCISSHQRTESKIASDWKIHTWIWSVFWLLDRDVWRNSFRAIYDATGHKVMRQFRVLKFRYAANKRKVLFLAIYPKIKPRKSFSFFMS